MPTLFTRIIEGELPSHTVWRDERCVAFLSINPLREGHTLVVPRDAIDHWIDVGADLWAHLMEVSRVIGRSLHAAFPSEKVGAMLAGLEVPHVHVHLVPIDGVHDLDFARAARDVPDERLAANAARLRDQLARDGHGEHAAA